MGISATLGNVVRIGPTNDPILVKDSSGALIDPTTITVTVKRPDRTVTTPTRDSLGTFHLDYEPAVTPAMVGEHEYRVVTTNPDAAYEGTIFFLPSPFI
jgi:hypothetical protein